MFLPIKSDRQLRNTPWVNYALIAINVVVFILTYRQVASFAPAVRNGYPLEMIINELPAVRFYLWPTDAKLYQFFSYQFLHQDWLHLLGNMAFLYVFGNHVEDRLGKIAYLLFYLSGGIVAGIGHVLLSSSPVLGASGAVAAVTGAYLVFFPMTYITIGYWFFFIGTFEVSGLILICFRIGVDLFFQLRGGGNVAYMAHLAGYALGLAVCMAILWVRIVPREPYDLIALIQRYQRRRQFKRLTRKGYHPWDSAGADGPGIGTTAASVSEKDKQLIAKRAAVTDAIANHDMPAAAKAYAQMLGEYPDQVMSQQSQLDLANQLMSESRYDVAAPAYELMLSTYPSYPQREHVQLVLGLIYGRYLNNPGRARQLLNLAIPRLSESDQQLAKQVLAEIES